MVGSTTQLVANLSRRVSEAAQSMEERWTYAALRRITPDVAQRLHDQRNLFAAACVTGSAREVVIQGEALCRGYAVAVRALEESGEADDAYVLGHDLVTGLTVAIGQQRAAVQRIREVYGDKVIWVTPDEVARMLAGIESFKVIGAVKKLFPGAEVLDRYEEEGNNDGEVDGQEEAAGGDAG